MATSGQAITTVLYKDLPRRRDWRIGRRIVGGNTRKSVYYNGVRFDSEWEAAYAAHLESMKRANDPRDRVVRWEKQIKFSLDAHGAHIANHFVDFHVWYGDGRDSYVEIKGWPNEVYPFKRKILLAQYPDIDYRVLEYKGGDFLERKDFSRPR